MVSNERHRVSLGHGSRGLLGLADRASCQSSRAQVDLGSGVTAVSRRVSFLYEVLPPILAGLAFFAAGLLVVCRITRPNGAGTPGAEAARQRQPVRGADSPGAGDPGASSAGHEAL